MIKFEVQWYKEQYPNPDFTGSVRFDTWDEANEFYHELRPHVDHVWLLSVKWDDDEERWIPVNPIYG